MESPSTAPSGLSAKSEPDLASLFEHDGPFVSVYLETDPEAEPASHTSDVHWRDLRRQLVAEQAPAGALEAIESLVPDAHRYGVTMAAIAGERGLLLVDHHDEPLVRDLGRVATLPSIGPILEWRERRPPYVVALVDLAGADLFAFARGEEVDEETAGDQDPHDPLLHKVSSGGWSQHRYQRRVERHWDEDAKAVAEELAAIADRVGARVLLAGGDPRALARLREALPEPHARQIEVIPASRAADGNEDHAAEAIERAVATAVARDHAQALAAHRELSEKGLAGTGAAATLEALGQGQVQLLLVNDDPDDDRRAYCSLDPFACAMEPAPLRALGVEPLPARLVDVAVAAAFTSGAMVRIVPAAERLADGIGALWRFATSEEGDASGSPQRRLPR